MPAQLFTLYRCAQGGTPFEIRQAIASRLNNRPRFARKGYHRTVGSLPGIDIQELYAINRANFVRDLPDNIIIDPLAEIGHTFDHSHALMVIRAMMAFQPVSK